MDRLGVSRSSSICCSLATEGVRILEWQHGCQWLSLICTRHWSFSWKRRLLQIMKLTSHTIHSITAIAGAVLGHWRGFSTKFHRRTSRSGLRTPRNGQDLRQENRSIQGVQNDLLLGRWRLLVGRRRLALHLYLQLFRGTFSAQVPNHLQHVVGWNGSIPR